MCGNKRNITISSTGVSEYESALLEFLDRELSASAEPVQEGNTQQEEVEALVSDLLKMAMAAIDEQDPHLEVESPCL